jgi:hypothetical protein
MYGIVYKYMFVGGGIAIPSIPPAQPISVLSSKDDFALLSRLFLLYE